MGIKYFAERNIKFFQTSRDSKLLINAEDFDNEFNALTKHINNIIDKIININNTQFVMEINNTDTYKAILNVGDGRLEKRFIRYDDIIGKIDINKVALFQNCSSIFSNLNGFSICPYGDKINDNKLIFISTINNIISSTYKLYNINFDEINGNKIRQGSISYRQLKNILPLVSNQIAYNSIYNNSIKDSSITCEIFKDNSLSYNKIHPTIREARKDELAKVQKNTHMYQIYFPSNNLFNNRHFTKNLITKFSMTIDTAYSINYRAIFTKNNIPNNIIDKDTLKPPLLISRLFVDNTLNKKYFQKPFILIGNASGYKKNGNKFEKIIAPSQKKLGLKHLHPDFRKFLES